MQWYPLVGLCYQHRWYHRNHLTGSEAVPHMSTNDDEYNGFFIPKGTIVIGNSWLVRPLEPIFCPDIVI